MLLLGIRMGFAIATMIQMGGVLVVIFVNLTQARIFWEEGASIQIGCGQHVEHFLD